VTNVTIENDRYQEKSLTEKAQLLSINSSKKSPDSMNGSILAAGAHK